MKSRRLIFGAVFIIISLCASSLSVPYTSANPEPELATALPVTPKNLETIEAIIDTLPISTSSEILLPVPLTQDLPLGSVYIAPPTTETVEVSSFDVTKDAPFTTETTHAILVKFDDARVDLNTARGRAQTEVLQDRHDMQVSEILQQENIAVFTFEDTNALTQTLDTLSRNSTVEYAQPNFTYTPAEITTNDPLKTLLWGLDNTAQDVNGVSGTTSADIDAPEAWTLLNGSSTQSIVAVIDTGVAYTHPDLVQNMWDGSVCKNELGVVVGGCIHGYDYEENDSDPFPSYSTHGTHVAGTIAATHNNNVGVLGVSPYTKVMAIKSSLTTVELIKSIQFASQNGARVINASWTGTGFDPALRDAIAAYPGLFVTAAGNNNNNNDAGVHYYPSDFDLPNIISVAAINQNDARASFSNYGATSVDIAAPGTNIMSTFAPSVAIFTENFNTTTGTTTPSGWSASTTSTGGTYEIDIDTFLRGLVGDTTLPYRENNNSVVTSPAISLPSGGASISFTAGCDTEYTTEFHDYMQLEYSADGVTFTPARDPYTGDIVRFNEASLDLRGTGSFQDQTGATVFTFSNIPIQNEYIGPTFAFQFRWVTNEDDNNYAGCFIDNIEVVSLSQSTSNTYTTLQGTSMAAPHVSGAVALIMGYLPSLDDATVRSVILNNGDTIEGLQGIVATGKRLNIHKTLVALTVTSTPETVLPVVVPPPSSGGSSGGGGGGGGGSKDSDKKDKEEYSVIINKGDKETESRNVKLKISEVKKATQLQVSNDSDFDRAKWIPFTKSLSWELTAKEGTKTVYVRYGDKKGKELKVVKDKITLVTKNSTETTEKPSASETVAKSTTKFTFTKSLKLNAKGTDVTELQKILIKGKYLKMKKATGTFDKATEKALKAFQKKKKLKATGILDKATRAALNK